MSVRAEKSQREDAVLFKGYDHWTKPWSFLEPMEYRRVSSCLWIRWRMGVALKPPGTSGGSRRLE
jgi:hypothetical protein